MRLLLFFLIYTGVLMSNSLPKHYTTTLDNGLEVVAIPMHNDSNVISIDLFYKAGSRNEIMGKSGLAHMLEHMNFKSTKELESGEFDKIVKGFGGVNNASTSFDYTHYFIKSSTDNLEKSLPLFKEMMTNLELKDEEFQPERDVVMEERLWRTDNNPMGFLYFNLFNHLYVYHPYHWTPIGFIEDIRSWSVQDLRKFYETYYQPQNAILIIAGDITKERVFEQAKKTFKDVPNRGDVPKVHMIEPEQKGAKRIELEYETQVEMVAIAYKIPNYEDKDTTTLNAIAELLGSGKSSPLQQRLVDEKKLANSVYAYALELKDPGVFLFMAICNPGVSAESVEKEILHTIEEIKTEKVEQDELEKLKINTKADFIFSLENSSSVSNIFGAYLVRGNLEPLETYEQAIEDLNATAIQEVANRYFVNKKSTTVILRKGNK